MDRWRSEHELAQAEWWTLDECRRHLGISERTLRRYIRNGLPLYRLNRREVAASWVKRVDAQAIYRRARHAERSTRFQA